ncbi:MAG TPA: phosphoribosyl-AMP cyclohydrolase [Methylocella sp.]|nr:phosphoribosyl-AMP cyclohydrolase [Methylocella sp.]
MLPQAKTADPAKQELEEGTVFTPHFDADGLIVCVTRDVADGQILMLAYMNAEALRLTFETGFAHYWSRSRKTIWRKGDTSGQRQKIVEIRTDCDQDALLLTVEQSGGGACHTGRRSCFYRKIISTDKAVKLVLAEHHTDLT